MLKVDECRDDEQRNENPVSDRDLPREGAPNGEKKKRGNEFDRKITKRNLASAICAATAQSNPTDEWQILIPGNFFFAGGTKGSPWAIDGKIARQAIDADVEKRTDDRAENECENFEEQAIGKSHAILLGGDPCCAALHEPRNPDAAFVKQTHRQAHRDQGKHIGRWRDNGRENKDEHDGIRSGARHEGVGD